MPRNSLKSVMRLIDIATEDVPIEKSFLSDLKRSIELQDAKGSRLPSKTYKPSSMQCIRNMYFQVMGVEPDPSDTSYQLVGICNAGSDIHQRVQQSVIDMVTNGVECEYINVADFVRNRGLEYLNIVKEPDFEHGDYETKLYHKDLNISFLCDGIIKYRGRYYILELKTETSSKFYSRAGVDTKHYDQGTAYSVAFGINDVLFVYISRDNLDMKSFMFNVTDEMRNNLVDKIKTCDSYVADNQCPPKPEDVSNKICNYCGYKNSCIKEN